MKEIEAKRLESQIKKAEAKEESKESFSSSSVDEQEI